MRVAPHSRFGILDKTKQVLLDRRAPIDYVQNRKRQGTSASQRLSLRPRSTAGDKTAAREGLCVNFLRRAPSHLHARDAACITEPHTVVSESI